MSSPYEEQLQIIKSAAKHHNMKAKELVLQLAQTMDADPNEAFQLVLQLASKASKEAEELGDKTQRSKILADEITEILGGSKPAEYIGEPERQAVSQYLGDENVQNIKTLLQQKQGDLKRRVELLKRDPRLSRGTDEEKETILHTINSLERQIITGNPEKALADIAKADASPDKEFTPFLVNEFLRGNVVYPDDLRKIASATKNFLELKELDILEPEQLDLSNYSDFEHFVNTATSHADPLGDFDREELPPMDDIFELIDFLDEEIALDKEELAEIKRDAGKDFSEKKFRQDQFKKSLALFIEYLSKKGFHTRDEQGTAHSGARRYKGEKDDELKKDITGEEEEFSQESLDKLYEDTFYFLSYAPGPVGGAPANPEAYMEKPQPGGKHLDAENDSGVPTRKFLLNRLQQIYFGTGETKGHQDVASTEIDPETGKKKQDVKTVDIKYGEQSPQQKWESIRNWLISGVGLGAYGLQTIKGGDWSLGVEKMPRKAKEQYKGQSQYGKELAGYFKGKGGEKFDRSGRKIRKTDKDKGSETSGPTVDQIMGEDMSAKGLRLYLTEQEAIASIVASSVPSADQYREIVEAHGKGVWLGINEGYNEVPDELDPREDEESGYDNLEEARDISVSDIPYEEKEVEMDDMMEAVASQTSSDGKQGSPDGKGVQDKGVGEAISGTDNETPDLKGVNSKGTEGSDVNSGGNESGDTGGTESAKQESPDGNGLQKKSVGKQQF